MRKILYITNIEVPYKVKFFNMLAKKTDLTVLYERHTSANRDSTWSQSEKSNYKKEYLDGITIGNENGFSLSLFKYLNRQYDEIIISCINSPVQIIAILYMKIRRISYILSFDGEFFLSDKGFKSFVKKRIITGASKYLAAGETSAKNISKIVNSENVYPYYFGSYTDEENVSHQKKDYDRENYVLVVGQYFDYKGLDTAVKIAKLDKNIKYKFIGMGNRTALFCENEKIDTCSNIEVIPFLSFDDLNKEYEKAGVLLLPSKKECWGLVINEAASFGTPIVSTYGSGAAVEFLTGMNESYLFAPNDVEGMYKGIIKILNSDNTDYSNELKEKSRKYSIEKMVQVHIESLDS